MAASGGELPGWSPPALLIDSEHPMRVDMNRQLGALAALGTGFMTTLRLPGAEERPVARILGVERDPRIGISSGPLLALYQVDDDKSWRGGEAELALAAKAPPPPNTSFSVLVLVRDGGARPVPETRSGGMGRIGGRS